MAQLRSIDNSAAQFVTSVTDFLRDAVNGCGVRFESLVSRNTSLEVFSLVGTYGARMSQFCIQEGLLVCTSKNWPHFLDGRITSCLRRLQDAINSAENSLFSPSVCNPCYVYLGFLVFFFN